MNNYSYNSKQINSSNNNNDRITSEKSNINNLISEFKWGEIRILRKNNKEEFEEMIFKDAKCYPDYSISWDWNETGTRHSPGIQISDVKEIVEKGAEVVVLSKGIDNKLLTKQETLDYLEEHKIKYYHLQSNLAVEKYNELLLSDYKVGGLFHSTC